MEKKIFSLNLACTVFTLTDLMPQVSVDEESGSCYFTFVDCAAVPMAIKQYKNDVAVPIQKFLRCMKQIRVTMNEVRENYIKAQNGGDKE